MRETRISLNEDDFRTLVAGGTVRREGGRGAIAICLQDIGYDRMAIIVDRAIEQSTMTHEAPSAG